MPWLPLWPLQDDLPGNGLFGRVPTGSSAREVHLPSQKSKEQVQKERPESDSLATNWKAEHFQLNQRLFF